MSIQSDLKILAGSMLLVVVAGCPLRPTPIDPSGAAGTAGSSAMGGASPVSSDDLVCAHLVDLGCPEGQDSACRQTLAHLRQEPIIVLDRDCILLARDRPSARQCQGLLCPEPKP